MAESRTPLEYVLERFVDDESTALTSCEFTFEETQTPTFAKSKLYESNDDQSARALAMKDRERLVLPALATMFHHSLQPITKLMLSKAVHVEPTTTFKDKKIENEDYQPHRILIDFNAIADLKPFDPSSVPMPAAKPAAFAPHSDAALEDKNASAPPIYSEITSVASDPSLDPLLVDSTPEIFDREDLLSNPNNWKLSDYAAFIIAGTIVLSFLFPQVVILSQIAGWISSTAAYFGISTGALTLSSALASLLISDKVLDFCIHGIQSFWRIVKSLWHGSSAQQTPLAIASSPKSTHASLAVQFKKEVDVAIMLDATGSMKSYILAAKDAINNIVKTIKSKHQDADIRIAIVGYRDYSEGRELCQYIDFTTPKHATAFLAGLRATGGKDTAEAVEVGLNTVVKKLKWRAHECTQRIRNLFIVNDAPPHGAGHSSDDYPTAHSTPSKLYWKTELQELSQLGITVHTMTCGKDLIAESVNREIAQQTQGIAGHLNRPEQFMKQAVEGIDQSIEEDAFELEVEKEAERVKQALIAEMRQEVAKIALAARQAKLEEELKKGIDPEVARKLADDVQRNEKEKLEKEAAAKAQQSKQTHIHHRYRRFALAAGASATDADKSANVRARIRGARYQF